MAFSRQQQFVNLIEISSSGSPAEEVSELPAVAAEVGAAYVDLYNSVGFARPWLGYFARQDSVCIGTCGFKGPPENDRVEIAYFTFPGYEGRGYATRMARALIDIAWETKADVVIAAQTLPNESASTTTQRERINHDSKKTRIRAGRQHQPSRGWRSLGMAATQPCAARNARRRTPSSAITPGSKPPTRDFRQVETLS